MEGNLDIESTEKEGNLDIESVEKEGNIDVVSRKEGKSRKGEKLSSIYRRREIIKASIEKEGILIVSIENDGNLDSIYTKRGHPIYRKGGKS